MKQHISSDEPIGIDRPMVIIPVEEYKTLLKEAGRESTPKLENIISRARANFRKGKYSKWEKVKDELL